MTSPTFLNPRGMIKVRWSQSLFPKLYLEKLVLCKLENVNFVLPFYWVSGLGICWWLPSFLFHLWRLAAPIFSFLSWLYFSFLSSFVLIFILCIWTQPHVFHNLIQDGLKISQCLYDQVLYVCGIFVFINTGFFSLGEFEQTRWSLKLLISQSSLEFFQLILTDINPIPILILNVKVFYY